MIPRNSYYLNQDYEITTYLSVCKLHLAKLIFISIIALFYKYQSEIHITPMVTICTKIELKPRIKKDATKVKRAFSLIFYTLMTL